MVVDVRHAYFDARATRRIFIELPYEDKGPKDGDKCGECCRRVSTGLQMQPRMGSASWEASWWNQERTEDGRALCLYTHEATGACAAVHGDDVIIKAARIVAEWITI